MKRRKFFLCMTTLFLLVFCLVFCLASCGDSQGDDPQNEEKYDFEFQLNSDNSSYTLTWMSEENTDDSPVIPSEYNGLPVTAIGEGAFRGKDIVNVTIPSTIKSIGVCAFGECQLLTNVYISDMEAWCRIEFTTNDTNCQSNPLYDAENLYLNGTLITELVIPDSITAINDRAFVGWDTLTSVSIPDSVTSIGAWSFSGCTSLTSATLGEGVEFIGEWAFDDCSLSYIILPKSIKTLDSYAFSTSSESGVFHIFYSGTGEEWESVNVSENYSVYSYAESIDTLYATGSYWHFNENGAPVIWNDSEFSESIYSYLTFELLEDDTYCAFLAYKQTMPETVEIPAYYKGKQVSKVSAKYCDKSKVKSIIIPYGITSVSGFGDCTLLEGITLPDSVTVIGESAFSNCTSLSSITLSKNLTEIGIYAFRNCPLTSIEIPSTVSKIDEYAFEGCTSLEGVNISDIDAWCEIYFGDSSDYWDNCTSNPLSYAKKLYLNGILVTELKPSQVSKISARAFSGCESITSVDLSDADSCVYIGEKAFWGCDNLGSIFLPDSLVYISPLFVSTVDGAPANTSLFIEDNGLYYIGSKNNPYLACMYKNRNSNVDYYNADMLHTSTKIVCMNEFSYTTEYGGAYYSGTAESPYKILLYSSEGTSCIIHPDTEYIVCNAFSYLVEKVYLLSNDIPAGLEYSLDKDNDDYDISLEIANLSGEGLSFELNSDGKSYSVTGFTDEELSMVFIPSVYNGLPVTKIANQAFMMTEITAVVIPDSVTRIGNSAFSGCSSLTLVAFGGTQVIDEYAFSQCSALERVSFTDSVRVISYQAFWRCTKLHNITLGNGIRQIARDAFGECSSLYYNEWANAKYLGTSDNDYFALISVSTSYNNYTLNDSVRIIASYAFAGCTSVNTVNIPDGILYVGSYAFDDCDLTYNVYGNGLYLGNTENPYLVLMSATDTSIASCEVHTSTKVIAPRAFEKCSNLTSVTLSEGLLSIGEYAFYECTSLSGIALPDSVEHIGDRAFMSSGVNSFSLGSGIQFIGYGCFQHTTLETITFNGTTDMWNNVHKEDLLSTKLSTVECTNGNITN